MSKYAAEVAEIAGRLSRAILQKDGDRLVKDPSNFDLEILEVLREVGKRTSSEVVAALASRVTDEEKKRIR